MITLNLLDRMTKCSKNRTIVCIRGIQRRGHDWEQEPFLRQFAIFNFGKSRDFASLPVSKSKLKVETLQSVHVL